MIDITHKSSTLRTAIAQAIVKVSKAETIAALVEKRVPKGDVFEMAKTAGLFGVKRTSDLIPDCHPLPIEFTSVSYEIKDLEIYVTMEVKTIYKTGVEVEAMHGVSVVALTMYDMLKPIDKGIEIHSIKLRSKKGGKSDLANTLTKDLKIAIIICSDSVSQGKTEDRSGKEIEVQLDKLKLQARSKICIPDEMDMIQEYVLSYCKDAYDLILLTGGTGLSKRDVTPEAIAPLLQREIPGLMETARHYGQSRTPRAMLSRGLAGMIDETLVITLPGSVNGVKETMQALFPHCLHVFDVIDGAKH